MVDTKRMGRPPKSPGEHRVRMDLRVEPATFALVDALALEHGLSRTEVLERLVWGEALDG
jgi:hypothetical protein